MIKSNELRIGILVESGGKVCKVNSIHTIFAYDIKLDTGTNGHAVDLLFNNDTYVQTILLKDIFPIPITHDWIRKLGFNINSRGWSKAGLQLFYHKRKIILGVQLSVVSYRAIEYVHQLQNLYFAVTGEELIVNEPV
jgi:hypothetical protein